MASIKQQTTETIKVTSFSTGQANPTHPGFQQTSVELPKSDEVWGDYFNGVLRGSTDGYDGSDVTSKTFADSSSTGEGPPDLEAALADTNGTAVNSYIPDVSAGNVVGGTYPDSGHLGDLGSIASPSATSSDQPQSHAVADGISPSYELGKYSS